jgi:prepilin peptidase CpaA
MTRDSFLLLVALSVAIVAAVFDVQQHRIPNWLTYPGIVLGLALRGALLGGKGLLSGLAGFFLAGGIIFLFFLVRAMGAGDVKLMAVVGAFAGVGEAGAALLATAIFGGVLAIVYALYRGRLWATFKNVGAVLKFHAWAGAQAHPDLNLDNPTALRIPYGLAIALGTLYTFVAVWRR